MAVDTNTESVIERETLKERAKDHLQFTALWTLELIRLFRWPIVVSFLALGVYVYLTGGLPTIPRNWQGYLVYFAAGAIILWVPTSIALSYFKPNHTFLLDVLPHSGDASGWELTDEQIDDLTVEAPAGVDEDDEVIWEEVERDDLWKINIRSGIGYECTGYDPERNVARTSWMAGSSPVQIRAFEKELEFVKTQLSILADLGIEESISRTPIVRAITTRLARYMIRCHQQATIPNGEEIDGVVTDVLSEQLGDDWQTLEDKMQERLPAEYRHRLEQGNHPGPQQEVITNDSK